MAYIRAHMDRLGLPYLQVEGLLLACIGEQKHIFHVSRLLQVERLLLAYIRAHTHIGADPGDGNRIDMTIHCSRINASPQPTNSPSPDTLVIFFFSRSTNGSTTTKNQLPLIQCQKTFLDTTRKSFRCIIESNIALQREHVCVCVCVCEREREREREI